MTLPMIYRMVFQEIPKSHVKMVEKLEHNTENCRLPGIVHTNTCKSSKAKCILKKALLERDSYMQYYRAERILIF